MTICNKCQHQNSTKANFCARCGSNLAKPADNFDYNIHVKRISVFFFVQLAYVAAINFITDEQSYIQALIIDVVFALIILAFYFTDYKNINRLFKLKKKRIPLITSILIIAPIFAFLVFHLADFLNQELFNTSHDLYYEQFKDSPSPILLSILSIGVFPAIFEEIAFRGVVFNELVRIIKIKPAIIVSAILFTILHLSLISALWIFPIGLVFGYLRAKYRTLWFGIIGHFIYNSSIVIIEILMMQNG